MVSCDELGMLRKFVNPMVPRRTKIVTQLHRIVIFTLLKVLMDCLDLECRNMLPIL